eukprot:1158164-Pelagomonas_calceolata.AAC.6
MPHACHSGGVVECKISVIQVTAVFVKHICAQGHNCASSFCEFLQAPEGDGEERSLYNKAPCKAEPGASLICVNMHANAHAWAHKHTRTYTEGLAHCPPQNPCAQRTCGKLYIAPSV